MAWSVEVSDKAEKALAKLGSTVAIRIARTLREIAQLSDPRDRGEALTGNLSGYWRYRIGDWRAIARIEDERLIILVIEVGHRREVYR